MRISWNWLSEMVDLKAVNGPRGLAEFLTRRGLEVEAIHFLAHGFEKVVTAQILERNPHPQADRLSLCKVTTGQGEPLEIVCGAQNMKAGDKVALAQVGANLPNGLKISQSKIRGVVSNGMLCSEEELHLKDSSEGILILPPATSLGKPLAEVLGRDDTVFTFNLTANRGDCLSHWGIAREVIAALGTSSKKTEVKPLELKACPISIHLDAGEFAPQFWGCLIEGVKISSSPEWLVRRLESLGVRSINNVVDATNYIMLELGHPMHAYDADLIEGKAIHVRMARQGETLPLLDGQTISLAGTELVIADRNRAIGLAGVMGGGNSEVRPDSTRLFLECAQFSPVLVRRAASRHQRHTEAAHRFERGVDPKGLSHAIARLASLILELAGGKILGTTVSALPIKDLPSISMDVDYFSRFLGLEITPGRVESILTSHECRIIKKEGRNWSISVPSYRLDLHSKEDLAEELARSIGYDEIPTTVPPLTDFPQTTSSYPSALRLSLINLAKDTLAELGLLEPMNYAFTSRAWLSQFGMTSTASVLNPLSEEHEVLVPSLIPGLVRNALENWRHHFGSEAVPIRLFELRPTFQNQGTITAQGEMQTNVEERWKLAIALSGPRYSGGLRNELGEIDFFDLKAMIEVLFEKLGTRGIRFQAMTQKSDLFHPGQSVEILAGNQLAGAFGLLHPGKGRELKTRAPLWIAEIDWEAIASLSRSRSEPIAFKAWAEFPPIERDFALLVRDEISAEKITQLALKVGKPLAKTAKVFDVYRGSQVAEGMTSVAVRVIFSDEGRNLQEVEADAVSNRILEIWKKELGIELRI